MPGSQSVMPTGMLALVFMGASLAADYPTRPIRLIVPQSPGGTTDYTARLIGPRVGERLGQAVVVDNRPGAGSMLGYAMALVNLARGGEKKPLLAPDKIE